MTSNPQIIVCSHCRRVYLEPGGWQAPPEGLYDGPGLSLSHGICPDCLKRHFPEFG